METPGACASNRQDRESLGAVTVPTEQVGRIRPSFGEWSMRQPDNRARAFSLIELLVVILIIVIVISLVIPALGGARNIAKEAATQSMMKEFGNAVDQFRQDHAGLSPGIFRPDEMGAAENADVFGFSAMENALLALAGGIVYTEAQGGPGGGQSGVLQNFGPTQAAHDENDELGRKVRADLVGADYEGNPGYFQPDAKFLVAQERPNGQFGNGPALSDADIPDFVDAFGNPLLLWVEDDSAPDVQTLNDFAREDSDAGPAHFYWASNAAFLKATELGRMGKDQTSQSDTHSLLGEGVNNIPVTMAGLLGNPASPAQELDSADADTLLPASPRGRVIVHSAGANGLFVGNKERASKTFDADASGLRYGLTYFTDAGTRRTDTSGTTGSENLVEGFDDIFLTFGN